MLVKEDHCDGLGNCLPNCPVGAITFEERDISPAAPDGCEHHGHHAHHGHGSAGHTCPSAQSRQLQPQAVPADVMAGLTGMAPTSMLAQWPAQIKLMPLKAPYYDGANLLVAADCTAYAYANFHAQFMRSHVTLIGCPKLDDGDYTKSSPPSSETTTSRACASCAWKSPAAAVWNRRSRMLSKPAANSFPGRWSPFLLTGISSIDLLPTQTSHQGVCVFLILVTICNHF